jgi:hypothetical protein
MELLLYKGDWDESLPEFASAPAIPPRKISRPALGGVAPSNKKVKYLNRHRIFSVDFY